MYVWMRKYEEMSVHVYLLLSTTSTNLVDEVRVEKNVHQTHVEEQNGRRWGDSSQVQVLSAIREDGTDCEASKDECRRQDGRWQNFGVNIQGDFNERTHGEAYKLNFSNIKLANASRLKGGTYLREIQRQEGTAVV